MADVVVVAVIAVADVVDGVGVVWAVAASLSLAVGVGVLAQGPGWACCLAPARRPARDSSPDLRALPPSAREEPPWTQTDW